MRKQRKQRELKRQEVYVAPLHELPEEWERDNALFSYRLVRRSGWVGKVYVGLLLLFLVGGAAGLFVRYPEWLPLAFVFAINGAIVLMAIVVIARTYGRRRRDR